jgi:hypothetical protein
MRMTWRLRPPTESATPFCASTSATVEEAWVWKRWTMTRSLLCSLSESPSSASKSKRGRSLVLWAAAALVTVMSVPSPYSDCRTLPWAFSMPEDTELTTMTRAMPRASPEATTRAAFLRRRSSRLR